ncbi:S-crystallin SL11 [Biomphalaria glabrata]|uniref:Glutathione S-transferase 1-like isoform X2 n=1 Tax=Biomphalaria glabrata TaxID=6526 RepID=A0A9W3A9M2_BIOGL|nr:glutathione S-transferase 1-like isoform X2 [Biomphalaria glabrata]KAI8739435.1 S-crystallin SL11-like [Biomphalaria glabrata]
MRCYLPLILHCLLSCDRVYCSADTPCPTSRSGSGCTTDVVDQTYCTADTDDCARRNIPDKAIKSSEKSKTAPTNLKLVYFNGRGRAEVSRLILVAAGEQFEDVRLETFLPEDKAKTPFGQLPVLEIDGKMYAQSVAIATYLAREFGFYGETNLDALRIDEIVQLTQEIMNAAYTAYFYEPDENKQAELIRELQEKQFPRYLGYYEKLLKDSGTSYFVGNSLTLADLIVYDAVFSFLQRAYSIDGFPRVEALCQLVESLPNIQTYVAQREKTPF